MLTFAQLQDEVGEWSRRSFPNNTPRDPFEGICEEFGELAHSRLKGRQGIRGDSAKHEAGEKDALADMIIFACDYSERMSKNLQSQILAEIDWLEIGTPDDWSISTLQEHIKHADIWETPESAFDGILLHISATAAFSARMGSAIIPILAYANLRDFDLETIVGETWAQVRQRDWRKDPACGGLSDLGQPPAPEVKVMDFAKGEIVSLPPNMNPDRGLANLMSSQEWDSV